MSHARIAGERRRRSISPASAYLDSPTPVYLLGASLGSAVAMFVLLIIGSLP